MTWKKSVKKICGRVWSAVSHLYLELRGTKLTLTSYVCIRVIEEDASWSHDSRAKDSKSRAPFFTAKGRNKNKQRSAKMSKTWIFFCFFFTKVHAADDSKEITSYRLKFDENFRLSTKIDGWFHSKCVNICNWWWYELFTRSICDASKHHIQLFLWQSNLAFAPKK